MHKVKRMPKAKAMTKAQKKAEIIRCAKDPAYFITRFCKIAHPVRGLLPFVLYPFQETLLKSYEGNRYNIILKARQLGISTLSAAYSVWKLLFLKQQRILIMATQFDIASNLMDKIKVAYNHLPDWLKIAKHKEDNKTTFKLTNGSSVRCVGTSINAVRSEALSLLIFDEGAFIENMDKIWTASKPSVGTGGSVIVLSTPNGHEGFFHDTYEGALEGTNNFKPTKLLWDVHPERDQEWFDDEIKDMTPKGIAQEYLCSFEGSSGTYLDSDTLNVLSKKVEDPLYKKGPEGGMWVWEEPEPGEKYLLTADVARGDGEDFSAFHVIRGSDLMQVAEFKGKMTPDLFATYLNKEGRIYNDALLVVENNNHGYLVVKTLQALNYPQLYYGKRANVIAEDTSVYYDAEYDDAYAPGFSTNPRTRTMILGKMEEMVRLKKVKLRSSRMLSELRSFVWKNGKPQARSGKNDDLVMSLAIGSWVADNTFEQLALDREYGKYMPIAISSSKTIFNTGTYDQPNVVYGGKGHGMERGRAWVRERKDHLWLL